MPTFIRAAEIWVPDAQGQLLEFGSGLYPQAPGFGHASRSMCFGRGEGLPGRVWDEARPVLLNDLQGGYFQRAAAAKAAGLTRAIAFPSFFGDLFKAVVVFFCGDSGTSSGAIELWRHDPGEGPDLVLADGVYAASDAAFEAASRLTRLGPGVGLPGAAWQTQACVLLDGVSSSPRFARAGLAAATGLNRGLAMPCPVPGPVDHVLAFLSAPEMPIATRIERWVAGADAQTLRRAQGFDEALGNLPDVQRSA
ncbi:MAG: GAF domain-containing protein, partial [Pseudomonadota bacterium]|nr:GAF domain-containing protein [Pseudomonadota bacterium]